MKLKTLRQIITFFLLVASCEIINAQEFNPNNFDNKSANITNEWFPLQPGTQFTYEGSTMEGDKRVPSRLVATVTGLTKRLNNVWTIVVMEKDFRQNWLIEAELAFFAQDKEGNVWHQGQYTEAYDEGEFIGGQAWLANYLEGAKAGMMMMAKPMKNTPSYAEGYAPPPYNWTDRAQVYKVGQKKKVRFGTYDNVLIIKEFNQEEPNAIQLKYYAAGVGNIAVGWMGNDEQQEMLELVNVVKLNPEMLAKVDEEAIALEKRASVYGQTQPVESIFKNSKGKVKP